MESKKNKSMRKLAAHTFPPKNDMSWTTLLMNQQGVGVLSVL